MDTFLPLPEACADYERLVQAVCDREQPRSALRNEHVRHCQDCQNRFHAAELLLVTLEQIAESRDVSLPVNFADRVLPVVLGEQHAERRAERRIERRSRRLRSFLTIGALAASFTLAVLLIRDRLGEPAPVPQRSELASLHARPVAEVPPILVSAQLTEVRETLADLTRRTAEEALSPAQTFLPDRTPEPPVIVVPAEVTGATVATLADVPEAARTSLEPLTGSAERALNLFLRDVGLSQTLKPKS